MPWPFSFSRILFLADRHVWVPVRILHETRKAVLVSTAVKLWIPKSKIRAIRLRRNTFEIYVREELLA